MAFDSLPPFFEAKKIRQYGETIAIVSHSHPALSKGGAEISAYALFKGLRQIGVDAIFICACNVADRHKLAFADDNEFAVYYEAERYEHFYHLASRSVADQLVRIVQEERVQVVNFHHFLNLGLNSLRAVRAIPELRCFLTLHEFLAICHHHGQMITHPAQILCEAATTEGCVACFPEHLRTEFVARKKSMLDAFGSFDGFIAPSRFLADRFVGWGLSADRIGVIENGLLHIGKKVIKQRTSAAWTFGFFGQINPFKGVDVILDAAELIAASPEQAAVTKIKIHGNLIGQSRSFTDRFEQILAKFPFISYAGAYNSASVHRLMGECDYVIMPSKWWENSPLVIQEAYAAGVPVLCSGIGGMAEKVLHGLSGLHFRPGDAADLQAAMRKASDPQQAEHLREGIPQVISAADMAKYYLDFFANSSRAIGQTALQSGG